MALKKVLTLVLVFKPDASEVLLGLKKRGFGAGKWNGFGGKVEPGETIRQAAHRELQEEAGIVAPVLHKRGLLNFVFENDPTELEVHVFRSDSYHGEVTESEEMMPKWFPVTNIPFESMWLDDKIWFPLLLANKSFKGRFVFRGHDAIISSSLTESSLEDDHTQ
eukprot:GILK01007817.1.p1 GENE.GILK01007817.1~~GILK01007817.1.p1  ORF type:complete len:177 (+),score=31.35 GILK01007817.1:40-531(+)